MVSPPSRRQRRATRGASAQSNPRPSRRRRRCCIALLIPPRQTAQRARARPQRELRPSRRRPCTKKGTLTRRAHTLGRWRAGPRGSSMSRRRGRAHPCPLGRLPTRRPSGTRRDSYHRARVPCRSQPRSGSGLPSTYRPHHHPGANPLVLRRTYRLHPIRRIQCPTSFPWRWPSRCPSLANRRDSAARGPPSSRPLASRSPRGRR